jgi:hypothetical protein
MDFLKHPLLKLFLITLVFTFLYSSTSVIAVEVHQEYNWWEPSTAVEELGPKYSTCPACHESLGGAVAHPSFRKNCESCHLLGRSGAFEFYEAANLHRISNYSAPMVYYHIINASDSDIYYNYLTDFIEVPDQSDKFNSTIFTSCLAWNPETGEGTCHGISSENPVDGHFAFNLPPNPSMDGPGPFRFAVEAENLPDTSDCLYCHRQSIQEIVSAWGGPSQVDTSHFDTTQNEQCYECHVEEDLVLTTFHIMGPEPEVKFLVTTTSTTTTSTTTTTTTTSTTTTHTTPTTAITIPQTRLPPTTAPPTTQPPPQTTTLPLTPAPTEKPFFETLSPLYIGTVIAILLLIAVIFYHLKGKGKNEKESSK